MCFVLGQVQRVHVGCGFGLGVVAESAEGGEAIPGDRWVSDYEVDQVSRGGDVQDSGQDSARVCTAQR